MGEIAELTTWPKHQFIFYKISSNGMNFEIKAHGNPGIGLSSKAGLSCDFLIGLSHNNNCWIKKIARKSKETADTQITLSSGEYKRYWITWYDNAIRLGVDGETKPKVSFSVKNSNLKYISFIATEDSTYPVHWKIELPPILEKPFLKPILGAELYWVQVDADTQFPDGAYIGGYEKENLYIIRAKHRGSLTPGKFVSSEGLGYIPWGGDTNEKNSFEVLCGFDCTWVSTKLDIIPVGAVVAGHSEDISREKLYIGRAKYLNHIIPGKVQPSHKVCYIPYNGKEIAIENYEIMIIPQKIRSANKFLLPGIEDSTIESDENDEEDHSMDYDYYNDLFYGDNDM